MLISSSLTVAKQKKLIAVFQLCPFSCYQLLLHSEHLGENHHATLYSASWFQNYGALHFVRFLGTDSLVCKIL